MNKKYQEIFQLSLPFLRKGKMKDFVVHTENVVKAMELLIEGEGGDKCVLIPAAVLHDVGFSKVPAGLQTNSDLSKKREAQRQHLVFAKEIIKEILTKSDYDREKIDRIVGIVEAHKFQNPSEVEKQLLIDADNLSDTFKEQFWSDVKSYNSTSAQIYEFRTRNEYYTDTAKKIAEKNMTELKKELNN